MHRKLLIIHPGVILAFALLALQLPAEMIYLQGLPANPILLDQVEFRLNSLLRYLKHSSLRANRDKLYQRVKLCEIYLQEMEKQTALNYLNVLSGAGNQVRGIRNIVLGENNRLEGCKNWVFTADYRGTATHTLLLDCWKIDLDNIEAIRENPQLAISKW